MYNLYDNIWKRKSTRKYNMSPIDDDKFESIMSFAQGLEKLYPEIKTSYKVATDIKILLPIKAPYYFLIYSEQDDNYLENIGFMWQQMDLYLSSLGLGSCWLGMAKPTSVIKTDYPFVIALAFGMPEDSPYRELSSFNRKPISEISSGSDSRIEAARLAPSATNSQNWFFDTDKSIDIYQKKVSPLMVTMYEKMNKIDIGISLCHLFVATQHEKKQFVFRKEPDKFKKGYTYFGTID